jgi:hypothetical protein
MMLYSRDIAKGGGDTGGKRYLEEAMHHLRQAKCMYFQNDS